MVVWRGARCELNLLPSHPPVIVPTLYLPMTTPSNQHRYIFVPPITSSTSTSSKTEQSISKQRKYIYTMHAFKGYSRHRNCHPRNLRHKGGSNGRRKKTEAEGNDAGHNDHALPSLLETFHGLCLPLLPYLRSSSLKQLFLLWPPSHSQRKYPSQYCHSFASYADLQYLTSSFLLSYYFHLPAMN